MPNAVELAAEVERLRKVNKELLEAKHSLKAKVGELEASNVTLREKADAEVAAKYEAIVNVPLKRMALKLSPVPDIFLSEFTKDFKLDIDDRGALILLTPDGKPVIGDDKKPLEVNEQNLYAFLGSEKTNPGRATTYSYLLTYRGASGGGAGGLLRGSSSTNQTTQLPRSPAPQVASFGLK